MDRHGRKPFVHCLYVCVVFLCKGSATYRATTEVWRWKLAGVPESAYMLQSNRPAHLQGSQSLLAIPTFCTAYTSNQS